MTPVLLIPVALSLLVLGAHFFRAGNFVAVGVLPLVLALLMVRRPWAARIVQGALLLGALEWVRTLLRLASWRSQAGEPAGRLVAILGGVALATALSALVFRTARLRHRYGLERPR